jgi:hypothetical protein
LTAAAQWQILCSSEETVSEALQTSDSKPEIRGDLLAARERAWRRLAAAGTWWSGAERVAIAAELRAAPNCAFCRARKDALTPAAIDGQHDRASSLPAAAVDAVHRVATDPGRLTRSWVAGLAAEGISDAHYVELVGVLATVLSIDTFHRSLGLPLEPLPEPLSGEPSRRRPQGLTDIGAFVPVLARARGENSDLWDTPYAPGVIRALSLVPDEVRQLTDISKAQYLAPLDVANFTTNGGRALSRPQMELIAGRVSALNECFY